MLSPLLGGPKISTVEPPAKPAAALADRVRYDKRVFARGTGRTPTSMLKLAIARAAQLEAEAEATLCNPLATSNDKVRITHAARIARRDLAEMIATRQREQSSAPLTLEEMLGAAPDP